MEDRVLVAYASKSGTTVEVAQAIAEKMVSLGHAVDLRRVDDVADHSGYSAILVGSAVRYGKWLAQAARFVEAHRQALSAVPTAFFTVHGLATDDSEESRQKREAYVAPIRLIVKPDREAFFGGRIDYARLGLVERQIARLVKAPEQDLRDWRSIRAWAGAVHEDIVAHDG
jgi:menaquinone-dependent protoporphyrinogen oxidase